MKLTLKKKFQNLADQISFPIFFYIYETGKLIGANEGARELIGRETKNVNQIWREEDTKDCLKAGFKEGFLFLKKLPLQLQSFFLEVDMEFCFFQMGQEHIVTVLLEQSYKEAFGEDRSTHIPRILWKDKWLHIRGQNAVSLKMAEGNTRIEPGYKAVSPYDQEVLRKAFAEEKRLMEEQLESYGVLQQVKLQKGKRGFAKVNRLPLVDKNSNCIGILVIYELLQEREETRSQLNRILRQNAALQECLKKEERIAYVIREDDRGTVDYLSEGIEVFGYQPEEFYIEGAGWLDIVCGEDKERLRERERPLEEIEYWIYTKAGGRIKVHDKPTGFNQYQNQVFRQGVLWKAPAGE